MLQTLEEGDWNLKEILHAAYPDIMQFCIFGMNEYAYRLYRLLIKHGIPVAVAGEKWSWFNLEGTSGLYEYPDYARYCFYAEGTEAICGKKKNLYDDVYNKIMNFFVNTARKIMQQVQERAVRRLNEKGITVLGVSIPEYQKINFITPYEQICKEIGMDLSDIFVKGIGISWREEILQQIYGQEVCCLIESHRDTALAIQKKWNRMGTTNSFSEKTGRYRLYVIGPCLVAGYGCKTDECMISQLQKLVDSTEYQVIGIPVPQEEFEKIDSVMEDIPVREKDIIVMIFYTGVMGCSSVNRIDCTEIYNNPERRSWFDGGEPLHLNADGTKALAEHIYASGLKSLLGEKASLLSNHYLQYGKLLSEELEQKVYEYVAGVREAVFTGRIGAIVMNANPFTIGHQYLIENASKEVDYLYIFVVEEDKSAFTFCNRLEMVRRGTEYLKNVKAVPSGRFILSFETMPIYFEKEIKQEMTVDAGYDLELFARYIAPTLNISIRFVGEEPIDKVTRQYNEQMRETLREFGVEWKEIPRLQKGRNVISASAVRRCLVEQDWDGIKKLVPDTTYRMLRSLNVDGKRNVETEVL